MARETVWLRGFNTLGTILRWSSIVVVRIWFYGSLFLFLPSDANLMVEACVTTQDKE